MRLRLILALLLLIFFSWKGKTKRMDPLVSKYGLNEKNVLLYRYIKTIERMSGAAPSLVPTPKTEQALREYVYGATMMYCVCCHRVYADGTLTCVRDNSDLFKLHPEDFSELAAQWEKVRKYMKETLKCKHVTRRIAINLHRLQGEELIER